MFVGRAAMDSSQDSEDTFQRHSSFKEGKAVSPPAFPKTGKRSSVLASSMKNGSFLGWPCP